jgi:hypothetical protein
MSDTITPKFSSRRAKGEVIFNPMNKTRNEVLVVSGEGYLIHDVLEPQGWEYKMDGSIYPYFAMLAGGGSAGILPSLSRVSDSDISDAVIEASTKVMGDRGRSSSNIYETLAEINQTIGLVGSITENFTKIIMKTRLRSKFVAISNLYLLARYGVAPLLSDINNVMASLGTSPEKVRQTTRSTVSLSGLETKLVANTYGVVRVQNQILIQDRITVRGMSLDEYVATAASRAGFDAKGLYMLPWELTTLSFVADWFANIGSCLAALVPTPGVTQLGSCLVINREKSTTYTAVGCSTTTAKYRLDRPVQGSCTSILETTTRGALSNPGVVIKSDFRFDQLTRTLDALAVAQSTLRWIERSSDAIESVRRSRRISGKHS